MRLVKLTCAETEQPIWINPDRVVAVSLVRRVSGNLVRVDLSPGIYDVKETAEEVVKKLTNPTTVDLPYLKPGQKVTITSNTDEEIIIKAPANVTHKDGDAITYSTE